MNKQEFLKIWAEKAGVAAKDADKLLEAFVDSVEEALKKDSKIQIIGFGNFELKSKPARKGVKNALTGGTYDIAASKAPLFKVAPKFKDRFNK